MAPPTTALDHVVGATPTDRNRVVDAMRAGSILVVVLWHWSMSVLRWSDAGTLDMPNPIDAIPGGWLLTWGLQVMALFVVGGYANLTSLHHRSRSLPVFARERARRLFLPLLPMLGVWAVVDALGFLQRDGAHRSVLEWGLVVFVPLWFIGVFAAVSVLAPLTARLHRRAPFTTLAALAGAIVTVDLVRITSGRSAIGWINVLLVVFTFAHQLGYHWRDGRLNRHGPLLVIGSLLTLAALTGLGPYPGSMVATESTAISNMNPTTAPIAVVAVLQLGLTILATPLLGRMLARRRAWKTVVAANIGAMVIFTWHMTALVVFIGLWTGLGHDLIPEPGAAWWITRPIWVMGPAAVLAGMVRLGRRLAPRWIGLPALSVVATDGT